MLCRKYGFRSIIWWFLEALASLGEPSSLTHSLTHSLTPSLTHSLTEKSSNQKQDKCPTFTFTMTSRPYIKPYPYPNHPKLYLSYLVLSIQYQITLSIILAAWSSFPGECSVAGGPFEERRYCFS